MDIETVRHLIQLMVDNDLSELEVQEGQTRVALKRRGEAVVGAVPAPPPVAVSHIAAPPSPAPSGQESPEARPEDKLITITSPMVGTFFAAHDPESPPYVQVGSEVEPDTVVCIIEAMKVYNEIRADVSGVIEQVLVRNEDPVEFGQPMFVVRPHS